MLEHDPRTEPATASSVSETTTTGIHAVRNALGDAPRSVVVAAAAVGGAALLWGLFRLISPPRRAGWVPPPARPSLLGSMFRSALVSAASALASRWVSRLAMPAPVLPAGESARVHHDIP